MAPKKKEAVEQKLLLGRPKAKQSVAAENFPFCTIEPHEARMYVPDDRFKWLVNHFKPRSEVSATLTIYDIAGLVPGAHKGEGLGNAFLSHIQSVDGIYHVVRAFDDPDVVHSEGEIDPVKDMQTITDELRLKDIDRCNNLVDDLTKALARNAKDKLKQQHLEVLKMIQKLLAEDKKWVSDGNWKNSEVDILNEYQFLTAKSVVYLVNLSLKDYVKQNNKYLAKIHAWISANVPGPIIPYSAVLETKLIEMQTQQERDEHLKSLGDKCKSNFDKIIQAGYSNLHLIHFFTCGEDEVKCWTIRSNTKAPQAAGTIHGDFERGFICAEVYKYTDLVELGSEAAVKAAGKYQQKGKDYIVEDGDIIFFKFNVTASGKK